MLRLSRDSAGLEFLPTPDEARKREAAQADARIRELDAELARRG